MRTYKAVSGNFIKINKTINDNLVGNSQPRGASKRWVWKSHIHLIVTDPTYLLKDRHLME